MAGTADTPTPAPAYTGIHHAAFLCRDAEETRRFYVDVLGFRMVAALVLPSGVGLAAAYATELGDGVPEGGPKNMLTMFFEVVPGNYITFFDVPHTLSEDKFAVRDGVEEYHLAFEVDGPEQLEQIKQRLREHDVAVSEPVDLQANHSIYFYDPNGVHLEVTIRTPTHDDLLEWATASAPDNLKQWMETSADERRGRLANSNGTREASEVLKRRVIERITTTVSESAPTAAEHE